MNVWVWVVWQQAEAACKMLEWAYHGFGIKNIFHWWTIHNLDLRKNRIRKIYKTINLIFVCVYCTLPVNQLTFWAHCDVPGYIRVIGKTGGKTIVLCASRAFQRGDHVSTPDVRERAPQPVVPPPITTSTKSAFSNGKLDTSGMASLPTPTTVLLTTVRYI